jgi:hypothetical protein
MGIFGKKEEKKEDVTASNEAKVNADVTPEVPTAPTAQVAPGQVPPPPPETPEQIREKSAAKMMITYYPDNYEVKIEGIQNLTSRALADIMIERAYNSYKNDGIAQASAIKLLDLLGRMQDSKKIYVPGQR